MCPAVGEEKLPAESAGWTGYCGGDECPDDREQQLSRNVKWIFLVSLRPFKEGLHENYKSIFLHSIYFGLKTSTDGGSVGCR